MTFFLDSATITICYSDEYTFHNLSLILVKYLLLATQKANKKNTNNLKFAILGTYAYLVNT